MAEETQPKWQGKAIVELKGSTADQIWPLVADFCGLRKWFPKLHTSDRVEGEVGQPGLVRYCVFSPQPSADGGEDGKVMWAKEKLVMINPVERCLSYEIIDSNVGMKSYVATWKVFPLTGDDAPTLPAAGGCKIEWSFVSDPGEGWTLDGLTSYITTLLQFAGKKMEEAVLSGFLPKWEGKVSTRLTKARPDQVWALYKDFFNFHKWFPSLATCHGIHGANGEPGCIRYCAGFSIPSDPAAKDDGSLHRPVSWSKEKLTAVDDIQRSLSYEIVDSNIGLFPEGGDDGQGGCTIEWSFTVDPVEGWALDDLVMKYEASVELKGSTADQIWPLVADFCNLHRWFPNLDTCYRVEGEAGQPGLVRYCASSTQPSADGSEDGKVTWAKEKLVMINPVERCLSYEIIGNNVGMKSYVATWKVLPLAGDDAQTLPAGGCKIEWSFVSDPVEGSTLDGLLSYVSSVLQFAGNKMEEAVLSG
ncbi:hypothetical protein Tsubulata_040547, partial [Turnera subulata]